MSMHAGIPMTIKFLALALSAEADWIVTGDSDLLDLHPFEGISVLTPADALAALERP